MMRLDLYLSEKAYAKSRTEAKNLISDGAVKVSGKVITKPAFEVEDGALIEITKEASKYVSRGGYKLEGALEAFKISPYGKLCIDVGASSGGFTDCLLQNGAVRVIAVDSGTMQLDESLRRDARVSVRENFNARYMRCEDFDFVPSLAVMDVSFISATYIIPAVFGVLSEESDFICLVKPQFEVGRSLLGKGGIVKNEKHRQMALDKVIEFAKITGFEYISYTDSPILGGDGNKEYLVHFKKHGKENPYEKHTDNSEQK
jgi:23S rRNA (cytidine1920-2'-O)/16S rRNA (cytidine1409-2'-O)-methyltransferase